MDEQKVLNELNQYRELAKQGQKVDLAALAIKALQTAPANLISASQKRWAYLISLGLPPFGLLFALKFYFSGKDDSKKAALICVVLTILSLFFAWLFFKLLLASIGTANLNQLQNLNPNDLQQLLN
ncbi:MAG TPA: hypothetical protein VGQ87_03150 [Patescibacteria group bacterium]|jgi:hypothetical protein|nr:hypothetical protein [Patescibacteria group bacterium]